MFNLKKDLMKNKEKMSYFIFNIIVAKFWLLCSDIKVSEAKINLKTP